MHVLTHLINSDYLTYFFTWNHFGLIFRSIVFFLFIGSWLPVEQIQVFQKHAKIGNNANIAIKGFTTWKQKKIQ